MTRAGYTLLRRGCVRVLVRDDVVTRLGPWLAAGHFVTPAGAVPVAGGRGGAFRTTCAGGLRVVVRPARRGGWLGRVVRETYVGWRPRPVRELDASVIARRRAVPTPAVLGVRVVGWGFYRGVVVTEEAAGVMTLAQMIASRGAVGEPTAVARAAGESVGRLHAAGVDHADLNLHNLLVPQTGNGDVVVIDLDKARVGRHGLAAAARRRNVRRLARSWRRVTGTAAPPPDLLAAFRAGYEAAGGVACEC